MTTTLSPATPKVRKPANKKFSALMALDTARAAIQCGVRGVRFGGGTERTGMVARTILARKMGVASAKIFGRYLPSDALDVFRAREFADAFKVELETWRGGWESAVSADTGKNRDRQYAAALSFVMAGGFAKIADAIETILSARAGGAAIVCEDTVGNSRPRALVDILDVLLCIRHTAAREASLKVTK